MDKAESSIKGNGHRVAIHDWEPVDESGVHKSSDRIEHDIEETRFTMDDIVDELSNRFNPHSYIDKAYNLLQKKENREKVRETLFHSGQNIAESFQRNPYPVLLLAAGATWLVMESRNKSDNRSETERPPERSGNATVQTSKERAGMVAEQTKEQVVSQKQELNEKLQDTKVAAQQKKEELQGKAREYSDNVGRQFQNTTRNIDQTAHNQILFLGAAAIFAGIIVGLSMPSTPVEKQAVGKSARDTLEKARVAGREAVNEEPGMAANVAEKTKEKLQEKDEAASVKPAANVTKENVESHAIPAHAPVVHPETQKSVVTETSTRIDQTRKEPVNPKPINESKPVDRKEK